MFQKLKYVNCFTNMTLKQSVKRHKKSNQLLQNKISSKIPSFLYLSSINYPSTKTCQNIYVELEKPSKHLYDQLVRVMDKLTIQTQNQIQMVYQNVNNR